MSFAAMAWALKAPLPCIQKMVLLVIAKHADDDSVCWPSHATIAREAGLCRRAVISALPPLVEQGWISITARERQNGGATSNLYTIHMVDEPSRSGAPVHQVHTTPTESNAQDLRSTRTPPVQEIHTSLSLEPISEPTIEPARTPSESSPRVRASWKAAFREFWDRYPNKVGKRAAETAFERAFKRIGGDNPLEVMLAGLQRSTCSRDWLRGFVCHPTTWLNQDRWSDEPDETPRYIDPTPGMVSAASDKQAVMELIERYRREENGDDRGQSGNRLGNRSVNRALPAPQTRESGLHPLSR